MTGLGWQEEAKKMMFGNVEDSYLMPSLKEELKGGCSKVI